MIGHGLTVGKISLRSRSENSPALTPALNALLLLGMAPTAP
jgi:hypothetical protein